MPWVRPTQASYGNVKWSQADVTGPVSQLQRYLLAMLRLP